MIPAPGSAAAQVALCATYERFLRGKPLPEWFPQSSVWLEVESHRRHSALLLAAIRCGFDPKGLHKHVSLEDWAGRRVRLIEEVMPNHVRGDGR